MTIIGLVLGGAAVLGGMFAHKKAKNKNEEARLLMEEAQEIYEKAQQALTEAQDRTKASVGELGNTKHEILTTTLTQFIEAYNRYKAIVLTDPGNTNELSKLDFKQEEMVQLAKLTNIYESSFKSGAVGAAAGASLALFAGGMAAVPLLTAIAGPVALFTGISASLRANANLEKAELAYSQARKAADEAEIAITLCNAITKQAQLFNSVLIRLNNYLSKCVILLDAVTKKPCGLFGFRKPKAKDITIEEKKLFAISRAIAGSVKAVITAPLLKNENEINEDATQDIAEAQEALPVYQQEVSELMHSETLQRTVANSQRHEKVMNVLGGVAIVTVLIGTAPITIPIWLISSIVKKVRK